MSPESVARSPMDTWLAKLLGQTPCVSKEELRKAFLQHVEQDGFASDESLLLAVAHLNGAATSELSATRVVEWQLRSEVEEFCSAFFDISPCQRSQQYRRLLDSTEPFPHLQRRLQQLEKGLSIDPKTLETDDPPMRQLVDTILELFVLSPLEQAHRRREKIMSFQDEPAQWEAAANRLQSQSGGIAELDRQFLEFVGGGSADDPSPRSMYSEFAAAGPPGDLLLQQSSHPVLSRGEHGERDLRSRMPFLLLLLIVLPVIGVVYGAMWPDGPSAEVASRHQVVLSSAERPPLNSLPPLPGSQNAGERESAGVPEVTFEPGVVLLDRIRLEASPAGQAPDASFKRSPEESDSLQNVLRAQAVPQTPEELGAAMIRLRDALRLERGMDGEFDRTAIAIGERLGLKRSDLIQNARELLREHDRLRQTGHPFDSKVAQAAVHLRAHILFETLVMPKNE